MGRLKDVLNFLHILIGVGTWVLLLLMGQAEDRRIWLEDGKAVVVESAPEEVKQLVAAANRIVGKPYKWGGGHGKWEDEGYDCSGAVSYALREAGLMKGVGTSRDFLKFGKKGEGEWITVWARKGHVFVEVAGLRFDTLGADKGVGPRWYEKERDTKKFKARKPSEKGL